MCKKLFAVLLVLGLVSSALAVTPADLQICYSFTQPPMVPGFVDNCGTLGPAGMGEETFNATNQGYAPGILGDAVILSLDGALTPPYDPNGAAWTEAGWEAGNIVDIDSGAEAMLAPFENKTISMWFKQTAQRDPSLHHPGSDGTEYLLGSYFYYSTFVALVPNADPNNPTDQLGFKAGGTSSTAGAAGRTDWIRADINMNQWYHAAMVLKNVPGEIGYNMEASFYLDGVLLNTTGGLLRASDAFKWGAPRIWELAAIGAYQCTEDGSTGHCTGALVDEFAIIDGAIGPAQVYDIYNAALNKGISICDIPEPATIALLGLGGLALLRRKR